MKNNCFVNIFVGNHGCYDGIEDYVCLLRQVMGARGLHVNVSSKLVPDAINIVIDEFTNYLENRRLMQFKKDNPHSQIILLLTEFEESCWGVKSYNHFSGLFNSAVIALFDVYLRNIRDDLGRCGVQDWCRLILFLPILTLSFFKHIILFVCRTVYRRQSESILSGYLKPYQRVIYMHMRYLGMKSHLCCMNAVMASHPNVISNFCQSTDGHMFPIINLGVLHPEYDVDVVMSKLMVNKALFIEITGSITGYRLKWIKRLNQWLLSLGIHHTFKPCQSISFGAMSSVQGASRGAYSLHPPQTVRWPYCSPMRIFRALAVDSNLPILTHHFHQCPIEDICFTLQDRRSIAELCHMYYDRVCLREYIQPRLNHYNDIAMSRNDTLMRELSKLLAHAVSVE